MAAQAHKLTSVIRMRVLAGVIAATLICAVGALAAALHVNVRPGSGTPRTTFNVRFRLPDAAGHRGLVQRSYTVSARRRGLGCVSHFGASITTGAAGANVTLRVSDRTSGLCPGTWRGKVDEQSGPYCPPGGGPCPEFPTRVSTIGRFSFLVRAR
jgi:hypothetical protein